MNNSRLLVYDMISILLMLTISCESGDEPLKPDDLITLPVDTLETVFNIGEEYGDSTCLFWSIIAADIDQQGRIFVLDGIDASLKVYDNAGNYVQHVTRRGAGPGELLYPRGFTIFHDGRILITAPSKAGYVLFSESFNLIEEISNWENNSPYGVTPLPGDRVVACRYDENEETNACRQTVGIYSLSERGMETLLWKDSMIVEDGDYLRNPAPLDIFCDQHLLSTCTDAEGNIYFGILDSLEYRIIQWDSNGNELLNITRDMTPVEKSPDELADETYYLNAIAERMWGPQSWELIPARYRNMIEDVGIGPDGNIWARRGVRTDLFFDIYDLSGNLLRHAVFPIESWSWQTKITPNGILAWELDPLDGFQRLYFLEQASESTEYEELHTKDPLR